MISYSQNGEDVILSRVLSHIEIGNYIDIGAGDPVLDSVTKNFYDRGWSGINIEPDVRHFTNLLLNRPKDKNLQFCVAQVKGEVEFWISKTLGWSTSDTEVQSVFPKEQVVQVEKRKTLLLDEILEMSLSPVHFLKIDCEGGEIQILESSHLKKNRPWIIIVEAVVPRINTSLVNELKKVMATKEYDFKLFDGLNCYFADRNNLELGHSQEWYAACILDDFKKFNEVEDLRKVTDDLHTQQKDKVEALKQVKALELDLRKVTDDLHTQQKSYRNFKSKFNRNLERITNVWSKEETTYSFFKKVICHFSSKIKLFVIHKFRKQNSIQNISTEKIVAYREFSSLGKPGSIVATLFKENPYVLVGATAQIATNSGVQRVARSFIKSLINQGFCPVLVKVNIATKKIEVLNDQELRAFMEPIRIQKEFEFTISQRVKRKVENGILLIPEVPYLSQNDPLICDVLLAYCNSNYLSAAAIYFDSIPITHKEYISARKNHESYLRFLSTCILVSPISVHSENELKELFSQGNFNVSPQGPYLFTKYLPLPHQLIECESEEIKNLRDRKFVLAVGAVEPRKNQGNLIKAFENLYQNKDESPILVIVGNIREDVSKWKLDANPCQVIWLANLDDKNLKWLYENCLYTVFLSLSEGFGYPILESQYFKKICVTSNFGSMKEIAVNGGCVLVDDPTDLIEIETALTEASERAKENFESLDFQDWDSYTSEFYYLVQSIIREKASEFQFLYWVDHTINLKANTGIQRVVRQLAKTLLNAGLEVVPVKWNSLESKFEIPNLEELENLKNWNGPDELKFSFDLGRNSYKKKFLVIPELTTYSSDDHFLGKIIDYAKSLEISVATVFHDALPVKLNKFYNSVSKMKHLAYMKDLIKSDIIFSTSKSSHKDLCDFILGQNAETQSVLARLARVDLPALFVKDSTFSVESIKSNKKRRDTRTILCVGTLEPRKNHKTLLKAFKKARGKYFKKNIELVLVGGSVDEEIAQEVLKYGKTLPIFWKTNVSDNELVELYKTCSFTVYPSVAEGFGLPILESLHYGKPVICGKGSSFDQLSEQGGCLQVDVNDPDALANAMSTLLTDKNVYEGLVTEARNRIFSSWEEYGSNFIKIILNLQLRDSDL
jgi:FkbM family methyltransferase